MQDKIDDLEYAIDNLDTVITILSKYEQFNKETADLKIYKSALELDLDKLEERQEELQATEQKEAQKENMDLERQYYKEAI